MQKIMKDSLSLSTRNLHIFFNCASLNLACYVAVEGSRCLLVLF